MKQQNIWSIQQQYWGERERERMAFDHNYVASTVQRRCVVRRIVASWRTVVRQNIGNPKTVLSNATTTFEKKGDPKLVRTDVRLPTFQSVVLCQTTHKLSTHCCSLPVSRTLFQQLMMFVCCPHWSIISVSLKLSPGHKSCYQIFRDKLQW